MDVSKEALTCPNCNSGRLWVHKTRTKTDCVRRIRICDKCGHRVATTERFSTVGSAVTPTCETTAEHTGTQPPRQ